MDEKGKNEAGIEILRQWVGESRRLVFFGGAGVSTESGIPDFRSTDGLYHQQYRYPPETILSHRFFLRDPEEFFHFYREKMLCPSARPNRAHRVLAQWEREGRLGAVITQNIDGLHQAAGSRNVLELHGSVQRNHCMECGRFFGLDAILESEDVPHCPCGGILKPDVVLYEEPLDENVTRRAVQAIGEADLLMVGGTSLAVYPAAGMLRYYQGNRLVLINQSPTPMDEEADLLLPGRLGDVLTAVTPL